MTIRPTSPISRPLATVDLPAAILATGAVGAAAIPPVISIAATSAGQAEGLSGTTAFTFTVTRDSGEDVFVHFRAIRGRGHRTLAEGQKVRYHIIENERGLQADDVTVIT